MTVHLRKLCVGAESIDDLARYAEPRLARGDIAYTHAHETRMWPRREAELLDGGSLYWIIKGQMCVRQAIAGLEDVQGADGTRYCRLLLGPGLVRVEPRPHRPFQGWRYLAAEEAPRDLTVTETRVAPELARELAELGLL